eukprot:scaffold91649_cov19-Tisochrysis_lutea.AAC.1
MAMCVPRIVASRNAALSVPMGRKKRMKHLKAAQWAPRARWLKAIDAEMLCSGLPHGRWLRAIDTGE